MDQYTKELEQLIVDELLPAYLAYARITGDTSAIKKIHPRLLAIGKRVRKVPAILEKKQDE